MAMPGTGCFVAWYDVKPGHGPDHDHWHAQEHMLERVAIPGFIRGFRYRALTACPRVFVMYQVDALATLASPAYLARLNNPTPWTTQSMSLFVGMNRTLSRVAASHGVGSGGTMLTIQLTPRPGEADRLQNWLVGSELPALARRPGLNGAHLLIGDLATSELKTGEKALRATADTVADWVLLVEGHDRSAVELALAGLSGTGGLAAHGAAGGMATGLYGLEFTLHESEAKATWRPAINS